MNDTMWIAEFLRETMLGGSARADIRGWASAFLDALRAAKPDQEIQIFGVCRVPKMPNYLLASTSETWHEEKPLRVQVNEKTAELFLAPTAPGIRILQEEMPMSVYYDYDSGREMERRQLDFYDAICIDGGDASIVLGLILNEGEPSDFLTSEELAELLPAIRIQAIPLLELYIYRDAHARLEVEIELMTGLMRDSNPDLQNLSNLRPGQSALPATPVPSPAVLPSRQAPTGFLTPAFFDYVVQELKSGMDRLVAVPEIRSEMNHSDAGFGGGVVSPLRGALDAQSRLVRNLSNLSSLMQPNVRPHIDVVSMQKFMKELETQARRMGARHEVSMDVDPHTRNVFAAGDEQTLLRVCARLLEVQLPHCRGGNCWIRVDEDPKRGEEGFLMLEIEDNGPVTPGVPLTTLLNKLKEQGASHPRLKNGDAVLFQFISLFLEKSGGKFQISFGLNGGFAAQFLLPRLTRAEVDRMRGKVAVPDALL